jgi:hypothetical protein
MRTRPAAALLLLALALALPAPAGQNAKQVREAPMDFDPAKPERIEGWWSNGQELMRLDPNGAYRMWLTQDRFKRPVEVGAWRRTNYVFFDLEPYRAKPGTRIRVNLQKDAGLTELVREGMADFRWLPGPPHVIADDMLGAWVSPSEQLLILDSGRYEWRRTVATTGITEHSGVWDSDNDVLVLGPDSPAIDTIRLRLVREKEGPLALESAAGRLMHAPAAPEPVASPTPGIGAPNGPAGGAPTGTSGPAGATPPPAPPTAPRHG